MKDTINDDDIIQESGPGDSDRTETAERSDDVPQEERGQEDELAALRLLADQLKDQLLRKVAEFENFRRRTREEQTALVTFANEGLITEVLPVLDDLDRSLKAGREHHDFDAFYKGVELVRAKLLRILGSRGLEPIVSLEKKFDETFHEALLQIPRPDVEPGTVIDEIETGYMLKDKVIRHAKVTVSSEPAT